MNPIDHQLFIYSPTGVLLNVLSDGAWNSLAYGMRVNEPGVLNFVLPAEFGLSQIFIDGLVEVYRFDGAGLHLEGETAFFMRKPVIDTDEAGISTITIEAYSALDLLKRRIIAYCAGSSFAEKVGIPWDNLMRSFVRENYGSLAADAERNLEPYLTVESDISLGSNQDKSAAWGIVLDALRDIIENVRSQGIDCTFDVVRTAPARFEFRVFLGPRGVDHSFGTSAPVIVSEDAGNLLEPHLEFDWTEEHNFIYATGQGQKDDRIFKTARDDARIGISPFNRQEYQRDARNVELEDSVQAEANAALEEHRPKIRFSGTISQTENCLYGVHWGWGDLVTVQYQGISINCSVETVSVVVNQDGTDIVTGLLRSVNDV